MKKFIIGFVLFSAMIFTVALGALITADIYFKKQVLNEQIALVAKDLIAYPDEIDLQVAKPGLIQYISGNWPKNQIRKIDASFIDVNDFLEIESYINISTLRMVGSFCEPNHFLKLNIGISEIDFRPVLGVKRKQDYFDSINLPRLSRFKQLRSCELVYFDLTQDDYFNNTSQNLQTLLFYKCKMKGSDIVNILSQEKLTTLAMVKVEFDFLRKLPLSSSIRTLKLVGRSFSDWEVTEKFLRVCPNVNDLTITVPLDEDGCNYDGPSYNNIENIEVMFLNTAQLTRAYTSDLFEKFCDRFAPNAMSAKAVFYQD